MAEFHELHGDYVANTGQTINLREYLDYFEPLGSALSRLPDGSGGPFVHQFTDSGGRTIGSIGWVVSAASKRFGAWTLWGMWTDRPVPAVTLPLFWSALADPSQTPDLVERANAGAERLFDKKRWPDLLKGAKTFRLKDELREPLAAQLEHAWSVPPPHRHSIEVELSPQMLDVLPWLYLLGPVDPAAAQLQPNRFNGAGYQYIFNDQPAPARGGASDAVGELVEAAATDPASAWRIAHQLRTQRGGRPKRPERPSSRTPRVEINDMSREPSPRKPPMLNDLALVGKVLYPVLVLVLLTWIAWNVNTIRKQTAVPSDEPAPTTTTVSPTPAPSTAPDEPSADPRLVRIGTALAARPPRNVRISDAALAEAAKGDANTLARVAIEIFLRRNNCFPRTEVVDGRLSTAEERAIRTCAALQDERLVKNGQPDQPRAITWLEGILGR